MKGAELKQAIAQYVWRLFCMFWKEFSLSQRQL